MIFSKSIIDDNRQKSASSKVNAYVATIIKEICDVNANKITIKFTFESFDIDSFMMFELKDKFKKINSIILKNNAFAICKIVDDIDNFIENDKISNNENVSKLKKSILRSSLKKKTSNFFENNQLFSDSTQFFIFSTRITFISFFSNQKSIKTFKNSINLLIFQKSLLFIQFNKRDNDAQFLILIHDDNDLSFSYRKIHNLIRSLENISNSKIFTTDT